jgi:hypothetical protein
MVLRSSVGIEIQDNFLEESYFKPIRDYVLDYSAKNSSEFNWFMGDVVSDNDSKKLNYVQFNHLVFCYNQVYSENFYNLINAPHSLLDKLDPYALTRIKLNLITRHTDVVESGMHIDVPHAPDVAVTSILYMNTNNGYTRFETGEKVESVANRLVTFPNNLKHTGTSCSDELYRCVMNIDYIKNNKGLTNLP